MTEIQAVRGRQVLDSRGNPTVEVDVTLLTGATGRAIVPSGASTGKFEAVELRDNATIWLGKGVQQAVDNVNKEIAQAIVGQEVEDQSHIDQIMIDLIFIVRWRITPPVLSEKLATFSANDITIIDAGDRHAIVRNILRISTSCIVF